MKAPVLQLLLVLAGAASLVAASSAGRSLQQTCPVGETGSTICNSVKTAGCLDNQKVKNPDGSFSLYNCVADSLTYAYLSNCKATPVCQDRVDGPIARGDLIGVVTMPPTRCRLRVCILGSTTSLYRTSPLLPPSVTCDWDAATESCGTCQWSTMLKREPGARCSILSLTKDASCSLGTCSDTGTCLTFSNTGISCNKDPYQCLPSICTATGICIRACTGKADGDVCNMAAGPGTCLAGDCYVTAMAEQGTYLGKVNPAPDSPGAYVTALSKDGSVLAVGQPSLGQTQIFRRNAVTNFWSLDTTLAETVDFDSTAVGSQGFSVAINYNGNAVAVGSPFENGETGVVRIYNRTFDLSDPPVASWNLVTTLTAPTTPGSRLGYSVSLSARGRRLVVGAPGDAVAGAAWVWKRSDVTGMWFRNPQQLTPSDAVGASQFGTSVSMSANARTVAVGGPKDNASQGAVWVFRYGTSVFTQEGTKLVGTSTATAGGQGTFVSLPAKGFSILAFAAATTPNAWVFAYDSGTTSWSQETTFTTASPASVAMGAGGTRVIIGDTAISTIGGVNGGARIYNRNFLNQWAQFGIDLIGSNIDTPPTLGKGVSVAISADGDTTAIGALGAAWAFKYGPISPTQSRC